MASFEQCRASLDDLADRLAGVDQVTRSQHVAPRTLSCRVPDLGVVFFARLRDGGLADIRGDFHEDAGSARAAAKEAQVRFTVGSDDLLALVDGRLGFAAAWATGRIRVDASIRDLLRLRKLV